MNLSLFRVSRKLGHRHLGISECARARIANEWTSERAELYILSKRVNVNVSWIFKSYDSVRHAESAIAIALVPQRSASQSGRNFVDGIALRFSCVSLMAEGRVLTKSASRTILRRSFIDGERCATWWLIRKVLEFSKIFLQQDFLRVLLRILDWNCDFELRITLIPTTLLHSQILQIILRINSSDCYSFFLSLNSQNLKVILSRLISLPCCFIIL